MFSSRSARRSRAVSAVVVSAVKPEVLKFEMLEQRVMMCATVGELVSKGIPESLIHDGHVYRSDFNKLSPELQQHFDPHWVQDDPGNIDYDKVYGKPLFNSEAEAHAAQSRDVNAAVNALPDFFPQILGSSNDTTTQSGRNLLRFGTQVNNQGTGPGSLISNDAGASIPAGAPITSWINPDGSQNVLQPVFSYTGSSYVLSYYRKAGQMVYHSGHGHLHYEGYASYALRTRNGDGTAGAYVQRADGSGIVGAKVGFCLLTFGGTFTTEGGQNSSSLPGFDQDTNAPSNCGYNQGIRVGHYDQYSSGLEGQWVDVTGVPNGQYFLEIKLDAEGTMAETNENNNAKNFAVNVNFTNGTGGITPDQYDSNGSHNDTPATAADMGELGIFTKTGMNINWGQDKDYYEFTAASGGNGTIATTSTGGDVDLYLYDAAGKELKQSTNASGSDSITWNFTKGEEYYIKVHTYNSTTSANYQVAWSIRPTVVYPVTDAIAVEANGGQNTGTFTVTRNGPTTSPTTVALLLGGTAVRDVDYTLSSPDGNINGNNLTIGNLVNTVHVIVTAIPDGIAEPTETVTLTMADGSTYVSGGGTSTVTINDRLLPRGPLQPVSVTARFGNTPILGNDDSDRMDEPLLSI